MEAPPINLFAKTVDPEGVRRLILGKFPESEVEGSPGGWASIIITRKRGLFKKAQTLKIIHNPGYYSGPEWSKQRMGMKGFFLRFPIPDDRRAPLSAVISEFAFALSFVSNPPVVPGDEDFRYDLMLEIAKLVDGCFFLPTHLLDSEGRVLVAADGNVDPDARFPLFDAASVEPGGDGGNGHGERGESPDEIETDPPSAERVAARAMVLAAVSARGMLELNASELDADLGVLEAARKDALAWCGDLGIEGEIEPGERAVLETPLGELTERQHLDSVWRFEGLAVLAWALGVFDLPPYDETAEPDLVLPAMGFLDRGRAKSLLESPDLRPTAELEELNKQMLAYHWRLREFGLRPKKIDFREFGEKSWFGPLEMAWANFDGDELALRGTGIHKAGTDVVETCSSIASERHLAINWLSGYAEVYSETDNST